MSLRREAISAGNWATVSSGIGLAGVAAAGILFWLLPEPDASTSGVASVLPRLTTDATGIDVSGSF